MNAQDNSDCYDLEKAQGLIRAWHRELGTTHPLTELEALQCLLVGLIVDYAENTDDALEGLEACYKDMIIQIENHDHGDFPTVQ